MYRWSKYVQEPRGMLLSSQANPDLYHPTVYSALCYSTTDEVYADTTGYNLNPTCYHTIKFAPCIACQAADQILLLIVKSSSLVLGLIIEIISIIISLTGEKWSQIVLVKGGE